MKKFIIQSQMIFTDSFPANDRSHAVKKFKKNNPSATVKYVDGKEFIGFCEETGKAIFEDDDYVSLPDHGYALRNKYLVNINSESVYEIFVDCVFKEKDKNDPSDRIIVQGIETTIAFDSNKISHNRDKILSLLDQLPITPIVGTPFSALNRDIDCITWTIMYSHVESLVMMGIAIGELSYFPENKSNWKNWPGGKPTIRRKETRGT